jgi:hypothetical protein
VQNEGLQILYSSPDIITPIKSRRIRRAGLVARTEKMNACTTLTVKQEGKQLLGRHRRRWKNNVEMDLREIYLWLYSPLLDVSRFCSFLILYTVCTIP